MIFLQKRIDTEDCSRKKENIQLIHDEDIFDKARKIFFENIELRDKAITVFGNNGEILYYLKWKVNQVESYCYVQDFWEYDISNSLMDYELLERGEVYLFFTFEEYTYHIARIVQRKYPKKQIFFIDSNAKLFFEESSYLHIISSIADLYNHHKECIAKTILTIDSKMEFLSNPMRFIIKRYRSLSVMTSLYWRCDVKTYGSNNPDITFYVIKDHLEGSGLTDMLKRAFAKIAMVQEKPGNIIPIIDFSADGDKNQFTLGNGENAWTLFFEQISEIPLEEVYKSKNVIVSSHKGWDWYNPYNFEKHCFVNWEVMFQKYVKIKKDAMQYIIELYNETIQHRKGKVLGVIGRGSDCYSSKGMMPKPMEPNTFLQEVQIAMKKWSCETIFLATEDKQVYDIFMTSELCDKIVAVDQYRVDYSAKNNYDLLLSEIKIREHENGYMDTLKYLGILYILSKCDSLMATCGCGAVQCALAFKEGKFQHIKIF